MVGGEMLKCARTAAALREVGGGEATYGPEWDATAIERHASVAVAKPRRSASALGETGPRGPPLRAGELGTSWQTGKESPRAIAARAWPAGSFMTVRAGGAGHHTGAQSLRNETQPATVIL